MQKISIAACLVAAWLVPVACGASRPAQPPNRVPTDTLVAGCSGGITGGGSGDAVTEAGDFLTWTRSGPAPSGTRWTLARHDRTAAGRLFAQLDRSGFDEEHLNDPGNVTCFLARRGPGRNHEVAWRDGQRPRRISAILAIYDQVRRPTTPDRRNRR